MVEQTIGPYRIEEEIGAGGMGAVYRAYDERLDRLVAIKTILPTKELSRERRARLRREARSAAKLTHPAIAQVHDIVTYDDMDHIVMEFVEGKTVAAMLREHPLEVERVVDIARQVAEGLAAAHERGIVHRDLKAENVMVTSRGRVKILDFGLAKELEKEEGEITLTQDGMVMGTCGAMSPEQAEGKPIDHRSDLFSLGTLLYLMITGKHPFSGGSAMETMRRVVFLKPPRIDELDPKVPKELVALVDWLLMKDPSKRPATAQQVFEALFEIGQMWTAPSRHSSLVVTSPMMRAQVRRRRWRQAAVAAAVVAAVGAVAGWLMTRPVAPTVVAVLRPNLAESADPERAPLAAEAIRMALLNAVAATEGLVAPDPLDIDNVTGNAKEVAHAVAAGEVLAVEVGSCQTACEVTVRRLAADGTTIRNCGPVLLASDDLTLVAGAMGTVVRQVYPERSHGGDVSFVSASPEDFEEFLRINAQWDHPPEGVSRAGLFDRLDAIRRRSPRFLEVLLAEVNAGRYLFEATADRDYLDSAREVLARAKELAPNDPRTAEEEFSLFLCAGELEAAEKMIDRMARLDPLNPRILACRGKLALRQGRAEEAITLLERAVAIRPSWHNFLRLAEAELHGGRLDEARTHLEAGLTIAPQNAYLSGKLAQVELTRGEWERAEELLTSLLERHGASTLQLANLGFARMMAGKYHEAIVAYQQAHERSPDNPVRMLNLGDCHSLLGNQEEARRWYQRAVDAASRFEDQSAPAILHVKAQCLAHLGRPREAAAAIRDCVQAAPDDPSSQYDAAMIYTLIGDRTSGLVSAERALELGVSPKWFDLPWFDSLRSDPGFLAALKRAEENNKPPTS